MAVMALMSYRSTPFSTTGFSPAKLLMKKLSPKWPDMTALRDKDMKKKATQAHYLNDCHGVTCHATCHYLCCYQKMLYSSSWTMKIHGVCQKLSQEKASFQAPSSSGPQQGAQLWWNCYHLQPETVAQSILAVPDESTGTDTQLK